MFLHIQKALLQIGTQAPDVVAMDAARLETSDKFEHQARHTRLDMEAVGVGDIYSNMYPTSAPYIDKYFIRKWLDICLQYFLDGGGNDI